MRNQWLLSTVAGLAALFVQAGVADAQTAAALTGQVSSAEEGNMEGVVVSAKKDGSTITVSVVTDAQGRLQLSRQPTRARQVHAEGARCRLRPCRHRHRRCRRGQGGDQPAQTHQDAQSLGTAQQRRMADEHAGHGRAEDTSCSTATAATPTSAS